MPGRMLPRIPDTFNYRRVPIQPFVFKNMTHQEFVDLMNECLPIKLVQFQDLIDRIHARYPLIAKFHIATIVYHTFRAIRNLLLLGGFFRIFEMLWHTHLLVVAHAKDGVRLSVRTSNPMDWGKDVFGRYWVNEEDLAAIVEAKENGKRRKSRRT